MVSEQRQHVFLTVFLFLEWHYWLLIHWCDCLIVWLFVSFARSWIFHCLTSIVWKNENWSNNRCIKYKAEIVSLINHWSLFDCLTVWMWQFVHRWHVSVFFKLYGRLIGRVFYWIFESAHDFKVHASYISELRGQISELQSSVSTNRISTNSQTINQRVNQLICQSIDQPINQAAK